jgi:hypothetical protein
VFTAGLKSRPFKAKAKASAKAKAKAKAKASASARTGARYAREKQVPRCARDDSQKSKRKRKNNSRFPAGMTERKAKATTKQRQKTTVDFRSG